MGGVRAWKFDAVIGVGGNGVEAQSYDINGKVNWIGIGARKHTPPREYRGPLVTFDHFVLFDAAGPDFRQLAPNLAKRIYATLGRCPFIRFNKIEQAEISRILKVAESEPASAWKQGDSPDDKAKCNPDFGKASSRRKLPVGKARRVACSRPRQHV
jgi:hypothetical protein